MVTLVVIMLAWLHDDTYTHPPDNRIRSNYKVYWRLLEAIFCAEFESLEEFWKVSFGKAVFWKAILNVLLYKPYSHMHHIVVFSWLPPLHY